MNKPIIIGTTIIVFVVVIYLFEQGEKDPNVMANDAPSHVKG